MSRRYTAQEMRSKADEFKEYLDNPNHFAVKEFDDESRVLMEMLRQAAALQEREEMRERKYEYSVYPPEICGIYQYRAGAELKAHMLKLAGYRDGIVVRREIGEWEAVSHG